MQRSRPLELDLCLFFYVRLFSYYPLASTCVIFNMLTNSCRKCLSQWSYQNKTTSGVSVDVADDFPLLKSFVRHRHAHYFGQCLATSQRQTSMISRWGISSLSIFLRKFKEFLCPHTALYICRHVD